MAAGLRDNRGCLLCHLPGRLPGPADLASVQRRGRPRRAQRRRQHREHGDRAILAGLSVPAFGVAWQAAADLAALRALGPLWRALVGTVPSVSAGTWKRGPVGTLRDPRIRLIRRTAEIRDAALALRCYVRPDPSPPSACGCQAAACRTELVAATEACWLTLAVRAARAGAAASESPHVLPGGSTLPEEVRWLRLVAAAFRSTHVRAVTAELTGEPLTHPEGSPPMTTAARPGERKAFARHVTDLLEPKNWIIAVTVLIGWHSGRLAGIGWGLLGALFAAILPTSSSGTGCDAAAGPTGTSAPGSTGSS